MAEETKVTGNKVIGCKLYNKANYPVTIKYDGKDVIVPPYARGFKLADASKVGKLPGKLRMIKGE